jgi:hypothetical protein
LSLKRKVETLEAEQRKQRRGQRCEGCASWPSNRIYSTDTLETAAGERLIGNDVPERCPRCRFEPQPIRIKLTEDWRGTRHEYTHE